MDKDVKRVIEQIEKFVPGCEQEEADKRIILSAIEKQGSSILTRESELFHITVSGFTVNEDKSKTLMVFHNIYNSWSWIGGHADGDADFLSVALKEAKEETGIEHICPASGDIISIDILTTIGHWKNGSYVAPHLHLNITYLLIGNEADSIRRKADENKAVGWILREEVEEKVTEPEMNAVYQKILGRI